MKKTKKNSINYFCIKNNVALLVLKYFIIIFKCTEKMIFLLITYKFSKYNYNNYLLFRFDFAVLQAT